MANDLSQRGSWRWLAIVATAAIGVTAASILVVKVLSEGNHHHQATPRMTSHPSTRSAASPLLDPTKRECSRRPSKCGYPDDSNTGVAPGVALQRSGCVSADTPGQVIENLSIDGCTIDVSAPDVVIRNVKIVIDDPTKWAIIIRDPGSAAIDHVDISGLDAAAHDVQYAVLSQTTKQVSVSHANLHNCSNCIQGDYVTATDNFIHDVGGPPAAHLDGILCISSYGCHLSADHNTVLSQGIAIALYGDFGTPVDSIISNNLVGGGSYTLYGGTAKSTNIHITDNRISRAIHPKGGIWGPFAYVYPHNLSYSVTGNIWDDTGEPVRQ